MVLERMEYSELVLKYELEPELRDIFVEGEDDVACLNTYFLKLGCKINAKVLPVDYVNIPKEEVDSFNLENNNRGRVIALSRKFENNRINPFTVTCIIDRDFDKILGNNYENDILLYTDYSCMEMYAFETRVLERFLQAHFGQNQFCASSLMAAMCNILQELFLIRLANKELNLFFTYLDFDRQICFENGTIIFNRDIYLRNYLNRNSALSKRNEIEDYINQRKRDWKDDSRFHIHGHDCMHLLTLFINKQKRQANYNEYTIWKTFFLSLELTEFLSYPLFNNLRNRVLAISS